MKSYFFLVLMLCNVFLITQAQVPSFTVTEVFCAGSPLQITNTSTGASTYEWNFCAPDLKRPETQLLRIPALDEPVYMDYVFTNSNYYAFITNYKSGDLVRLDFGSSLLNDPQVVNLGNFNDAIPSNSGAAGIQMVEDNGNWYAIIVAGYPPGGSNPRIIKISFGNSITNTNPAATNWGNIGNMYDPKDLVMLRENGTWYGFTVNAEHDNITRFSFINGIQNPPTGENLGNIGGLHYPTGLNFTEVDGTKKLFITNAGDDTRISGFYKVVRLDFPTSLTQTPIATDIGNISNLLQHPRDIHIIENCDNIYGLVLNAHPSYNSFLHLNFLNDITYTPNGSASPANQMFDYPYSFSEFTTVNNETIGFVVNKADNSITRVVFKNCSNASVQYSNERDIPLVTYTAPGLYTIKLTINKGTSSEASICKQIAIQICNQDLLITTDTSICSNSTIRLQTNHAQSYRWTPELYLDDPTAANPISSPNETIKYYVEALMPDNTTKKDSVIISVVSTPEINVSNDTLVCRNEPVELSAVAQGTITWSPATGLNNAAIAQPIARVSSNSIYRARVTGSNNCYAEDSVNISVHPFPDFKAGGNLSTCIGEPIILTASGGDQYRWSPATLVNDATSPSVTVNTTNNTVFQVNITTNTCNYDTTISLPVNISAVPGANTYLLPNAFSPNGDGRNDCFGLSKWGEIQIEQFVIYNRWGQAVFTSSKTTDCWDGNKNGVAQPSGAYLYVIKANTLCGAVTRKGMITLIR